MQSISILTVLAGLASFVAAVPLNTVPPGDVPISPTFNSTPALKHYSGYDPDPESIAAHFEGLPACYARCMLDQNKYFHTDMARFTFRDYCGFYWIAATGWEWTRVRGCALLHCVEKPCHERSDTCDVPSWIYQAHRTWLIEHCKGIRDVENYSERPDWMEPAPYWHGDRRRTT